MTEIREPIPRPTRRTALLFANLTANLAVLTLLLAPIFVLDWKRLSAALAGAHAPNLATIGSAPPLVIVHLASVIGALLLGMILLFGLKGTRGHRILGWAWAGLILIGALTSIFLRSFGDGFSFFHVITAITFLLLPLAVIAARTHRVRWHAGLMVYLFVNILLGAGIIALYPGFSERILVRAVFQ